MKKISAIAIFAFIGGGSREWLSLLISWPQHFWLTVIINVTGAFLLSLVTQLLPTWLSLSEAVITGLSVGLIGSFTTFSTFTFETLQLLHQHQLGLVGAYVGASLGLGLVASLAGNLLSHYWLTKGATSC
ncbi:chromosome condensation protein CrcB [Lactobacillus sp. CBA3605]|uniref:fluoride efflux transporter FluC n=1 Tax=Lactobacillus sp. CBA3605 TaxID=2099788 RepID=UPI000CFC944C|nr:CrcB family protein [Lactobacillus sp. CBA3605]AVK61659.1 chromosome condensation protein CrcB [Lactobacillus sp. CBA3605]